MRERANWFKSRHIVSRAMLCTHVARNFRQHIEYCWQESCQYSSYASRRANKTHRRPNFEVRKISLKSHCQNLRVWGEVIWGHGNQRDGSYHCRGSQLMSKIFWGTFWKTNHQHLNITELLLCKDKWKHTSWGPKKGLQFGRFTCDCVIALVEISVRVVEHARMIILLGATLISLYRLIPAAA